MKESILDVLLYLFEHCFTDEDGHAQDRDSLQSTLLSAGFSDGEANRAFEWLDGLAERRPRLAVNGRAGPTRVFTAAEINKLDVDARGFLIYLEQHGVLDTDQRELVVDRAMALDQDELDTDDLKWVVLMVLFNQPGSEAAYAWMETQMCPEDPEPLH